MELCFYVLVKYHLGNKCMEEYSNPRETTTTKGLLIYLVSYLEGMNFM